MNVATISADARLKQVLWVLVPAVSVVVATEFIVIGLLPLIAYDLGISLAEAGRLTGLFALSAAVAGPGLTLLGSRWSPRSVLVFTLLLYSVGNTVMASSSNFSVLLTTRIIQGAMLPAFVSVGAAAVASLAMPDQRGRALANANLGFVIGVLVALPAGLALAKWGNWRLPFELLSLFSLVAAAVTWGRYPNYRAPEIPSIALQLNLLRNALFLGHLLLSVLLFASMFAAYTFLAAWLDGYLNLSGSQIALTLLLFSAIGLVGNSIAARVADRAPVVATVASAAALVVAINLAGVFHNVLPVIAVLLVIWSVAHTAGVTLSQVRVTMAGGRTPAFAMTMNLSCANLGIAIGAFCGGWAIDRGGVAAIGWVPAIFGALATILCIVLARAGLVRNHRCIE